jgi:hypothetical protein
MEINVWDIYQYEKKCAIFSYRFFSSNSKPTLCVHLVLTIKNILKINWWFKLEVKGYKDGFVLAHMYIHK